MAKQIVRQVSRCAIGAIFAIALGSIGARAADPPDPRPARGAAPAAAHPARSIADQLRTYTEDRESIESFYNIWVSPARVERLVQFETATRDELKGVDFDALEPARKIDYVLLSNHNEAELRSLARGARRMEELQPLLPFRDALIALEETRWRVPGVDPEAAARTLDAAASEIEKIRKQIEQALAEIAGDDSDEGEADEAKDGKGGEDPADDKSGEEKSIAALQHIAPAVAHRAARAIDAMRGALDSWYSNIDSYKPDFAWWVKKPYDRVYAALGDYGNFLREKYPGEKVGTDALAGDPIGRDALVEEIAREFLPYTPEELLVIGEREFDWCDAEMKKTAAEMGLGDDWKGALARVKGAHMPPGQQPELVIAQSKEAIAFLDAHDLVTIPDLCRETWRYEMLSEDGQRTLPYAAYNNQRMMVAYPTRDMTQDAKEMSLRGNNIHFTRIVTPHELIPGHHLQHFMVHRYNTQRKLFDTPFWTEGWALYWEMLLDKLHYWRGPEDRMGMLFWRKHRAARIVVSLNFHLGTMTPKQMIDFLVERVGHEREGATSEVRRYIGEDYGPLYQCGYMIGGLQIMALRRELVESGKMTDRAFHDAILMENSIPIELVRSALTGAPVTRDMKSTWRFYDKSVDGATPRKW